MGKSDGRMYDEVNADYKDVCEKFGNLSTRWHSVPEL